MPTLFDTYRDYETDQLEMIAEQWGIEAEIDWRNQALKQIIKLLENRDLFIEILDSLPESAQHAMDDLAAAGGRIDLAKFTRDHGQLREMGAAIREKARPDRNPKNNSERLFYLGLTGIAFFEDDGGTKEFVFIPDAFFQFLKEKDARHPDSMAFELIQPNKVLPVNKNSSNTLIHMLCLRLASLRGDIPRYEVHRILDERCIAFLDAFLSAYEVLDEEKRNLDTQKIEHLLITPKNELQSELFSFWYGNEKINELRSVPDLEFDGQWINDPLRPRHKVIELINHMGFNDWVILDDFIKWVHENEPDFLRTGGEYEQWFIRQSGQNAYLKGFETWPLVDGAFARYLITGPLNWLGFVEVSRTRSVEPDTVFRQAKKPYRLLTEEMEDDELPEPSHEMLIHKNGDIFLPHNGEREIQYQTARFCSWTGKNATFIKFKLNPKSLRRAKSQNISPAQVQAILNKYGQPPVPENILRAVGQWGRSPDRIVVDEVMIIRFEDPRLVDKLMKTDIRKIIKETLNESTLLINRKHIQRFEDKLSEMGFLVDIPAKYNQPNK